MRLTLATKTTALLKMEKMAMEAEAREKGQLVEGQQRLQEWWEDRWQQRQMRGGYGVIRAADELVL